MSADPVVRSVTFLAALGLAATMGCAAHFTGFDLDHKPGTKIPLRAGLYLSPGFRAARALMKFPLGEAMAVSAEKALNNLFDEVVVLKETDDPRAVGANVVVSARFENVIDLGGMGGRWDVVCRWTVATPEGRILYVNTVTGTGSSGAFSGPTRIGDAMSRAVKDHYEKLIPNLVASDWWKKAQG